MFLYESNMCPTPVALTVVFGAAVLLLFTWKRVLRFVVECVIHRPFKHSSKGTLIPRTEWKPFAGDFFELTLRAMHFCKDKRELYGDVYCVWFGSTPHLMLANPEVARDFYRNQSEHVRDHDFGLGYMFVLLMGKAIGVATGQEWTCLRRLMDPYFGEGAVTALFPMMNDVVKQFVDEHFATPTASTAGVHVCESLRFFPFNVLARAIFGRDIERNGDLIVLQQLCDDYQDLLSCVFRSNSLRFKWQRYIPSKINRKFDEFWSRWCRICDAYILGEVIVEDKANLMASLATAFQDHPGHMDRRDAIYQTVAEALFANLDVSVGSTCWALADVASRPPEQERLRSYVQGICYDSSISDLHYNKLSEMEDVGFFLKESARMHPIFPVTVPEKTPYGTTMVLGNYIIPGGTPVCLDSYAINRHPAFWKDPESFRPDRFKEDPGLSRFLSRYGMGPRKCLGFRYANMFMSLMLIQVVSRFRLETPPDPPQYEKFTFVAPDSVIRFVPLKQ